MDLNTIEEVAAPRGRGGIGRWRAGDAWLAGGTWLFSEPQPGLRRLIDLGGLGWPPCAVSPDGLHLGATCTFAELAALRLPPAWSAAPLFPQCCEALLGSFKVQAVATVGGNLCLALPAGPVAALATALDGTCRIWTQEGGERLLPAASFVLGDRRTALRPGELLRAIEISAEALARRTAYRRASLTPHGRSAALLIGTCAADGAFGLTVTAATPLPIRMDWPALPRPAELRERLDAAIPPALCLDDPHGRPDWRAHMTRALAADLLAELGSPA